MPSPFPPLPDLIARFLRADLSFGQTTPLLGAIAAKNATLAELGLFQNPHIAEAELEKLTLSTKETVVVGIAVEFVKPITIDFADLARRYGPEREYPRVKPTESVPFGFRLNGFERDGMILLRVPDGSTASRRSVSSLIIRRFPPETHQRRAPMKKED